MWISLKCRICISLGRRINRKIRMFRIWMLRAWISHKKEDSYLLWAEHSKCHQLWRGIQTGWRCIQRLLWESTQLRKISKANWKMLWTITLIIIISKLNQRMHQGGILTQWILELINTLTTASLSICHKIKKWEGLRSLNKLKNWQIRI